jgi:hypothetical protein
VNLPGQSTSRGDVDTGRRLTAWDETLTDLETGADAAPTVRVGGLRVVAAEQ